MISTSDIVVVGLVIIVLFGAPQIPKVARSLGEGLKEFKKALSHEEEDKDEEKEEPVSKKKNLKSRKKSANRPRSKK